MRVAAVDIGTNTVRLLVADVAAEGLHQVERMTAVTRLGEGVDRTGALGELPMERTLRVLVEFGEAIARLDVDAARAVATSACRDAQNCEFFLDSAAQAIGVMPDVIDGHSEAALAFAGATIGVTSSGRRLVVDIGGGSTEFVLGTADVEYAHSVDVGSVRVTERWLPERPAPAELVAAATDRVANSLRAVALPSAPDVTIGVAGTFTTLAAVHLGLAEYIPGRVHGTILTTGDIDALTDRLSRLTVEETAAIPAVERGRAEVLLGGSVVAGAAVRAAGMEAITISETDLLDGIALHLALAT